MRKLQTSPFLLLATIVGGAPSMAHAQEEPGAPAAEAPVLAEPTPASAEVHPGDPSAALADFLEYERAQLEKYRIVGGVSALAVAAAAIPTGIVLLDHGQSTAGGITVGVGAGAGLGALLTFFVPQGTMTSVISAYDEAKARGLSSGAVLDATERAWRKEAETTRTMRQIFAPILLALGAGAIGTGVYFAASDSMGSMSASDQAAWSAALVAGGAGFVIGGAQALCFDSPIEASWEQYRRTTGRNGPRPTPQARIAPTFGVTPLLGGGYVSAGATF